MVEPPNFDGMIHISRSMVAAWIRDGMPQDWGEEEKAMVEGILEMDDIYKHKSNTFKIAVKGGWTHDE